MAASRGGSVPLAPEVVRDSKIVFISEFAQIIFGLVIIGILSNDLTLERFGIWFSVIAVFQFMMIVEFGFSTVVARFVPEPAICNKTLISNVRKSQIIISIILIPICIAVLSILFDKNELIDPPIIILGVSTLAVSCTNINRTFLRTIGLSYGEVKISLVDRGVTVFLLVFSREIIGVNEVAYLVSFITGPVIGFFFSSYLVNSQLPQKPVGGDSFTIKDLLNESLPFAIDSVLTPLSESVTRIAILIISGAAAVAIFEIAWKVFVGGSAIVRSIRKSMLSSFSSNKFDHVRLSSSIVSSTKLVSWLAPLGIFCGTIGSFLIPIVFSEGYRDSIPVFIFLLGAWGIMLIGSSFQVSVQSLQHGNKFLILTGSGTLIQLIFVVILTSYMGASGAAASILISHLTMILLAIWMTAGVEDLVRIRSSSLVCMVISTLFVLIASWEGQRYFSLEIIFCSFVVSMIMFAFLSNENLDMSKTKHQTL